MTLALASTLGASLPPSVAANPKYWLKDIAIWPSGYLPCPDGANSKPQLFTAKSAAVIMGQKCR